MKILISAAETSSDAHGAELLKALKELAPEGQPVDAFGIGGPKLRDAGLRILVDARELLAMGFIEIFWHLPKILRALRIMGVAIQREQPDLAIVIDYPDFHFRLGAKLKKAAIPAIYYIPPKVWAWRKGRIKTLRKLFRKILCILPFEVDFYSTENVPVSYVGNPLIDELPLKLSRSEARTKLSIDPDARVLLAMPGSRPSELKRHLDLFLEACGRVARELGKTVVLMPFPITADREKLTKALAEKIAGLSGHDFLDFRISFGNSAECMIAADVGMIKSGTSTLEAGLLGCPHCIIYNANWLTNFMFKHLVRYRGPVGLSNLVAGWTENEPYLIRELVLKDATSANLASEAVKLFTDEALRARIKKGLSKLREKILGKEGHEIESPSRTAAKEILAIHSSLKGASL